MPNGIFYIKKALKCMQHNLGDDERVQKTMQTKLQQTE